MEGESIESGLADSRDSEERSVGTGAMREGSQSDSTSGYNYDNFFDDLMEVATSADIEVYFDPTSG